MTTDRAGRDHLTNAVIDRDVNAAERLLADGLDPNAADRAGWTPLHFAAQNNDVDLVRVLLRYGASPERRDQDGSTPLFRAVFSYRGGPECVSTLLEAGADPDAKNNHEVSPRILAQTIANYDVSRFFAS